MAQARGSALLSKKRKYPATTSDDRFDFSRSDDDFQNWRKDTKDTKVSNCWALKLNSEWAKARREHMNESNLTEMSLLTDNRDTLGELFAFESFRLVSLMIHV